MVIAPNFQNDDGNHRVETQMLTFTDVDEESKVFYPRSNLGYVLPVKDINGIHFIRR